MFVDGKAVSDVARHPAFAPIAGVTAELFDLARGFGVPDPDTGLKVNRVFVPPRSREDLAAFREAATVWARHTHGWVGRSPDHVGAFLSAFSAHPEVFGEYAENVVAYRREVAASSRYVSYAIIPPQSSPGEVRQVGVVEERSDGIVVRGAQMLATGAAVADEVLVSCIRPLADDDADHALSFALPIATPGLRLLRRRPYATSGSAYDYPLSSRYDETDAVLVLDDVFVPWERVFVYRDVSGLRRQFFDTGAHVLGNWQAQIRFSVKLGSWRASRGRSPR